MAKLELVGIIEDDTTSIFDDRGSATFKTDTYKGKADRLLIWQVYADWMTPPTQPAESDSPVIDQKTGIIKVWFRNGDMGSFGPYSQRWKAWVANKSDWKTPISPVLEGTF